MATISNDKYNEIKDELRHAFANYLFEFGNGIAKYSFTENDAEELKRAFDEQDWETLNKFVKRFIKFA